MDLLRTFDFLVELAGECERSSVADTPACRVFAEGQAAGLRVAAAHLRNEADEIRHARPDPSRVAVRP